MTREELAAKISVAMRNSLGHDDRVRVLLKHLPPGWIPVEEALPERGCRVLVLWRQDIEIASLGLQGPSHSKILKWFFENETRPLPEVTHWMPLPEPPQ